MYTVNESVYFRKDSFLSFLSFLFSPFFPSLNSKRIEFFLILFWFFFPLFHTTILHHPQENSNHGRSFAL